MSDDQIHASQEPPRRRRRGHTIAKAPLIGLDQPGRYRVAHLMAVLGVSHATFYARLREGRYPPADGKDGRFPYWKTSTIKTFLDG